MASTSTSNPTVKRKLAAAKTEGMATNTITTKPTGKYSLNLSTQTLVA